MPSLEYWLARGARQIGDVWKGAQVLHHPQPILLYGKTESGILATHLGPDFVSGPTQVHIMIDQSINCSINQSINQHQSFSAIPAAAGHCLKAELVSAPAWLRANIPRALAGSAVAPDG